MSMETPRWIGDLFDKKCFVGRWETNKLDNPKKYKYIFEDIFFDLSIFTFWYSIMYVWMYVCNFLCFTNFYLLKLPSFELHALEGYRSMHDGFSRNWEVQLAYSQRSYMYFLFRSKALPFRAHFWHGLCAEMGFTHWPNTAATSDLIGTL